MLLTLAAMSRIGRQALATAGLALVLGLPHAAQAQSADVVGVHYPPTIKVEGSNLTINGSGISYRAVAKLYTVGLYVPQKASKAEAIFATGGPKQLRFVMLQGMRVDELGKVITKGIENNSSREEFFKLIPSIRIMGEQFSRIKRLNTGDVFAIEFVPKRGTMFFVNGQPAGLPLEDAGFFPAVLRTWLGNRPVTQDLKDALLDYKAPPVLDALQ
ncbi:MAG TPA: chalcone isomerase family protein [Aquabacterium sp.]|uniref:chalcone isomerase family protein n=1 Tax=Aquabacterium sp. TaxID=1872578 RepID=UPI002E348576|nr:chalcone isomerase family protein [Aquabacterium sp.]HEX5357799.1 chalcone isomerase family protein [Aquabacterium sp.]